MKFSSFMYALVVLCIVFSSCSQQEELDLPELSIDRQAFISGMTNLEQKGAFSKLSFAEQRDLWISKILQIEAQSISRNFGKELHKLRNQLNSVNSNEELLLSEEFVDAAAALARMTSEPDFYKIFGTLNDFELRDNTLEIGDNIEFSNQIRSSFEESGNLIGARIDGEGDACNCRWTCGDSLSQCTHSECEETSIGCGFLWMQSCEERDELLASECP